MTTHFEVEYLMAGLWFALFECEGTAPNTYDTEAEARAGMSAICADRPTLRYRVVKVESVRTPLEGETP